MIAMRAPLRRLAFWGAALCALLAAALLVRRLTHSVPPPGQAIDFSFLWVAGRMWAAGGDPYGAAYPVTSTRLFHDPWTARWAWVYPPQWWAIVRPLGTLPFDAASRLWRLFSAAALLAAAALFWRVAARPPRPAPPALLLLAFALTLSSEQVGSTLYSGQTSLLILLGLALFVAGAAFDRLLPTAAGLAVLMLKPNLGVPVAMMACAAPLTRRALPIAAAITLLGCVPLLLGGIGRFAALLAELRANLTAYSQPDAFNAPSRMTGLPNLWPAMSAPASGLLAGAVALALTAATLRRHGRDPAALAAALWLNGAGALAAIDQLHDYDLAFATTPLALARRLRPAAQVALVAGVLAIHSGPRAALLVLGGVDANAVLMLECRIDTLSGLLLLAAGILTAWLGWAAGRGRAAAG